MRFTESKSKLEDINPTISKIVLNVIGLETQSKDRDCQIG